MSVEWSPPPCEKGFVRPELCPSSRKIASSKFSSSRAGARKTRRKQRISECGQLTCTCSRTLLSSRFGRETSWCMPCCKQRKHPLLTKPAKRTSSSYCKTASAAYRPTPSRIACNSWHILLKRCAMIHATWDDGASNLENAICSVPVVRHRSLLRDRHSWLLQVSMQSRLSLHPQWRGWVLRAAWPYGLRLVVEPSPFQALGC